MKHDEFKIELSYIKDDRIRKSCETILDMLPDYFYEIPASSTGKYHPSFSLGKGGLVRHVKVATRIANDLFEDPSFKSKYTRNEKDIMSYHLILGFRLINGINKKDFYNKYHIELIDMYNILELINQGYLIDDGENIKIKYDMIYVENKILENFI